MFSELLGNNKLKRIRLYQLIKSSIKAKGKGVSKLTKTKMEKKRQKKLLCEECFSRRFISVSLKHWSSRRLCDVYKFIWTPSLGFGRGNSKTISIFLPKKRFFFVSHLNSLVFVFCTFLVATVLFDPYQTQFVQLRRSPTRGGRLGAFDDSSIGKSIAAEQSFVEQVLVTQ